MNQGEGRNGGAAGSSDHRQREGEREEKGERRWRRRRRRRRSFESSLATELYLLAPPLCIGRCGWKSKEKGFLEVVNGSYLRIKKTALVITVKKALIFTNFTFSLFPLWWSSSSSLFALAGSQASSTAQKSNHVAPLSPLSLPLNLPLAFSWREEIEKGRQRGKMESGRKRWSWGPSPPLLISGSYSLTHEKGEKRMNPTVVVGGGSRWKKRRWRNLPPSPFMCRAVLACCLPLPTPTVVLTGPPPLSLYIPLPSSFVLHTLTCHPASFLRAKGRGPFPNPPPTPILLLFRHVCFSFELCPPYDIAPCQSPDQPDSTLDPLTRRSHRTTFNML